MDIFRRETIEDSSKQLESAREETLFLKKECDELRTKQQLTNTEHQKIIDDKDNLVI